MKKEDKKHYYREDSSKPREYENFYLADIATLNAAKQAY